MKNDDRQKRKISKDRRCRDISGKDKRAHYAQELAGWIRVQRVRGPIAWLMLGSNRARKIAKWTQGDMDFSNPEGIAAKVVERAWKHWSRMKGNALCVVTALVSDGLAEAELDFKAEHVRTVPSVTGQTQPITLDEQTNLLGTWLQMAFKVATIKELALTVHSPRNQSAGFMMRWSREDFEKYVPNPSWFAPIIMEEASQHAATLTMMPRYTVRAYRSDAVVPFAQFAFRLPGGTVDADSVGSKDDPTVKQDVLDIVQRHQHAVRTMHTQLVAMHENFASDVYALLNRRQMEPRSTT